MELNTLLSEEQYDQEKELIEEKNETILACLEKTTNSDDQVKETNETNENSLSKTNSADQEKETCEKDKIVLPPLEIFNTKSDELEDDDDGFKTPTSLDQRIPKVPLQCPPAPLRTKCRTLNKRKTAGYFKCNCQRRIMLDEDIANEVDSMFPNSQVDDGDLGAINNKRSRN